MSRIAAAALAVLLTAGRASADDGVALRWAELAVHASLDAEGVLHVSETHELSMTGEISVVDRAVGFGPSQRVHFVSVVQLDGKAATTLRDGDPDHPGEYRAYDATGVVRWSVRGGETQSMPERITRRFRVDYDITGAVTPAWDLPAGDAPLDPFQASWGPIGARLTRILAAWREAVTAPAPLYRFDHDVLYPTRGNGPGYAFSGRLPYELEWDSRAWGLVGNGTSIGSSEDFRIRRTFVRVAAAPPAAVDRLGAWIRVASLPALPLVGLLLWAALVEGERRRRPRIDRAFFVSSLGGRTPEEISLLAWKEAGAPTFADFCEALERRGALAIDVLAAGTDEAPPRIRLHLRGRDALRPWESRAIDALFVGKRELTSDEVCKRFVREGVDPDGLVADALRADAPPPVASSRPLARWTGIALAVAALVLLVGDLGHPGREPFALLAGVLAAMMFPRAIPTHWIVAGVLALSPWLLAPLAILTGLDVLLRIAPNAPFTAEASTGLSLAFLAGYQLLLAQGFHPRDERGRELERLLWARQWAAAELARTQPDLDDAWIPALRAMRLGDAVEAWRAKHTTPTGSFTAVEPRALRRDDDWAGGFYPDA